MKIYETAIGTTAGGTEVAAWSTNSPTTATSRSLSSLALRTGQAYYLSVRATSGAGLVSTAVTSNGQAVAPTLTFSISTTAVDLGKLLPGGTSGSATVGLTVSTNAYNGYKITISSPADLANGQATVPPFNGAAVGSTDAYLTGDSGLGFSSDDTLVEGANLYQAPTCPGGSARTTPGCFGAITTTKKVAIDHEGPITAAVMNQPWNIYLKLRAPAAQAAGTYSTSLRLTAVSSF